jgi:4-amino-4-deoxy-L-arabinose transferase-like glycosyltransferase
MTARRRDAWTWAIVAVVVAGAAVRFATLDVQSMWLDEAVTHSLVTRSFGGMLSAIPHSESTPPLFYVLEWVWARVFGFGAVGLRSLSALFGSATIVVLAAVAGRLGGRRGALAAAAIAATNPLLIWYSQEARAYALLVLLCAVTVLCLVRGDWRGWALAAALALATHYFAVFIVIPQALWLLWRHGRSSRRAALSVAGVVVVGAALLPLAVVQASGNRARFISATSLRSRDVAVLKQFLIGYATPHATILTVLAALAALGLALSLRRRDVHLLALAAIAFVLPIALALAGADYVITRNLITAMVPLVVLAALAAARTRAGPPLVALLCVVGGLAFVGVELTPADQRDDWRGVASAIGPALLGPRVVVVDPSDGVPALRLYLPLSRVTPSANPYLTIREIDVIDVARNPPLPSPSVVVLGFVPQPVVHTGAYTLERYVAATPLRESYAQIGAVALVPGSGINGGPAILAGG